MSHLFLSFLSIFLSSSAFAAGSWYDAVGEEKGILKVRAEAPRLAEELEPALAPTNSACLVKVLEKIGWKVTRITNSDYVLFVNGTPCESSNLADVHEAGGLAIQIPESIDEATLQKALMPILGSPTSLCAYKFRVGSAAIRAAANLDRNEGFEFYQTGWPYFKLTRPAIWERGCFTRGIASCFFPRVANHEALNEFYQQKIATDCALGLQVVEYSTLHTLFGDAGMDERFQAKEIVYAPWEVLHNTESATWGRLTNSDSVSDPYAVETAQLGAQMFTGLSGYLGNVYGEAYLDTPIDRGENFQTITVSLRAAAEIKARGGFAYFNRQNVRAYQLGRVLNPALEELALTDQDPDQLPVTETIRAAFRELQSILSTPFYREYRVWVHPMGTMTIGEHIVRLLRLNPRTPYAIQLYPSRINRGLFLRYVNAQLATCAGR